MIALQEQQILTDARLACPRHEYQCREREKEAAQNPSHFDIGDDTPLGIIDHAWINGKGWEYRIISKHFNRMIVISETELLAHIREYVRGRCQVFGWKVRDPFPPDYHPMEMAWLIHGVGRRYPVKDYRDAWTVFHRSFVA